MAAAWTSALAGECAGVWSDLEELYCVTGAWSESDLERILRLETWSDTGENNYCRAYLSPLYIHVQGNPVCAFSKLYLLVRTLCKVSATDNVVGNILWEMLM